MTSPTKKWHLASLPALLMAIILAGCGTSNDDTAPTEPVITWQDKSAELQLPAGIRYVQGQSNDAAQLHYIELDLNQPGLALRAVHAEQSQVIGEYVSEPGVLAAINGGFFAGNSSYSALIDDNQYYARNVTALNRAGKSFPVLRSAFSLDAANQPSIDWIYQYQPTAEVYVFAEPLSYSANDTTPQAIPDPVSATLTSPTLVIGGGPRLVKDGVQEISYDQEIFWGSGVELNDIRPRSALCYTADNKLLMVVASAYKLNAMPELLISLGCDQAMNLDGGGSSAMAIQQQAVFDQGRPIPTALLVVDPSLYQPDA